MFCSLCLLECFWCRSFSFLFVFCFRFILFVLTTFSLQFQCFLIHVGSKFVFLISVFGSCYTSCSLWLLFQDVPLLLVCVALAPSCFSLSWNFVYFDFLLPIKKQLSKTGHSKKHKTEKCTENCTGKGYFQKKQLVQLCSQPVFCFGGCPYKLHILLKAL